jgi:hypothetical protein
MTHPCGLLVSAEPKCLMTDSMDGSQDGSSDRLEYMQGVDNYGYPLRFPSFAESL